MSETREREKRETYEAREGDGRGARERELLANMELLVYLIVLLASLSVIIGGLLFVMNRAPRRAKRDEGDQDAVPAAVVPRGGRRGGRRRVRVADMDDEDDDDEEEDEAEDDADPYDPLVTGKTKSGKKLGVKKLASLQRKQERKKERAYMDEQIRLRREREAEEEAERLAEKEREAQLKAEEVSPHLKS